MSAVFPQSQTLHSGQHLANLTLKGVIRNRKAFAFIGLKKVETENIEWNQTAHVAFIGC